jgi:hypothetical protein
MIFSLRNPLRLGYRAPDLHDSIIASNVQGNIYIKSYHRILGRINVRDYAIDAMCTDFVLGFVVEHAELQIF